VSPARERGWFFFGLAGRDPPRLSEEAMSLQSAARRPSRPPSESPEVLSRPRVTYQGERGAASEEAAQQLLGRGAELVPCSTFELALAEVVAGTADRALVPFENSTNGAVQQPLDVLLESPLHIVGETILRVRHHLIGCHGARIDQLEVVESHPVALAQCAGFLARYSGLRREPSVDTAGSVRRVCVAANPRRAALGSARAARLYGGRILRREVQDAAINLTRFVLVSRTPAPTGDKTSLAVTIAHEPGSLHRVLQLFAQRGVDLLRVETRPVHGKPWQYLFTLDIQGSPENRALSSALREVARCSESLRILGCFPAAAPLPRAAADRTPQRSHLGPERKAR
jgi:prephenate dehydratase